MPELRDTVHTKAFRAMFDRKPPYTAHTMRQSRAQEHARIRSAHEAGFPQRTEPGTPPHMKFHQHPTVSGSFQPVEADTGRVFSTEA
ncbi:hypothetical protein [Desulfovibrio ferrophilus]|uniref:Zinc finger family protein n=1 Tax=Desulfovibrio ferrophilus TaxID=241368 RepID=A0A2Z6AUB2_9BACT|nr:hypothetical protein [Desulfovibrio ferrophilus]BBD06815.1 zinc finger family protein [Desulfovibrio ferrophilus]